MVRTGLSVSLLAVLAAVGCGDNEALLHRTDLTDEPPGANCPAGGVRLDTGFDANESGALEDDEIEQTKYVCAGAPSTLSAVVPEPAGANCPAGGVKIETGVDADHSGTLDATEVANTDYVCGAGEAQIVKAFNGASAGIPADTGAEITLLSAEVTTATGGNLLAIASVDAYCTTAQCPSGTSGYLWISTGANVNAPVAEYDYWAMPANITESLTRTAHFPIADAGTHAFNLRGQDLNGAFTFYRPALTLVFLP